MDLKIQYQFPCTTNFPGQVIMNLSVFSFLMEPWIGSNVEGNLVITAHLHLLNLTKVKFLKELFHPYKFTSKRHHYCIFNFSYWLSNYILFLTFPRNNISSKKNKISCRIFVRRRSCLINITIPRDLGIFLSLCNKPCDEAFMRYLRICMITFQWPIQGACIN